MWFGRTRGRSAAAAGLVCARRWRRSPAGSRCDVRILPVPGRGLSSKQVSTPSSNSPTNLELPDGPADLTGRWLTAALQAAGHPDPAVIDVEVSEIGTGQTGASYRLAVTYAGGTDLPPTLVVKLPAQDPEVRQRVALGYRAEVAFYDSVADTVEVPLPRCFASAISEDAQQFALLLEDLPPAQQGDQIAGCSPDQARAGVVALAGLHGPRWCDPTWHAFTATSMPMADAAMAKGLGDVARFATDQFLERYGDRLEPGGPGDPRCRAATHRPLAAGRPAAVQPAARRLPPRQPDVRPGPGVGDGGRLADPGHRPAGSGPGVLHHHQPDPGGPADHEQALVAEYHDALSGWGVRDYSLDRCFDDYRLGVLQAPLITTLGAAFSTASERGEAMYMVMLERSCAAIRQLGTLELVDREVA